MSYMKVSVCSGNLLMWYLCQWWPGGGGHYIYPTLPASIVCFWQKRQQTGCVFGSKLYYLKTFFFFKWKCSAFTHLPLSVILNLFAIMDGHKYRLYHLKGSSDIVAPCCDVVTSYCDVIWRSNTKFCVLMSNSLAVRALTNWQMETSDARFRFRNRSRFRNHWHFWLDSESNIWKNPGIGIGIKHLKNSWNRNQRFGVWNQNRNQTFPLQFKLWN